MLHRDVGDVIRSTDNNYVVPSQPATYPQRGQQRIASANTIRLEEAVYEEEEEEEDDDEEITYSDDSDGDQVKYGEGADADVALASRKRDYEHGTQDPRAHAEVENGASKTPPKRTRVDGEYSPLTAAEAAAARISKRGSEEAALSSVAAGKRPRVGDGELGEAAEEDDKSTTPSIGNAGFGSEPLACLQQAASARAATGKECIDGGT